jgi:hypothetical protein
MSAHQAGLSLVVVGAERVTKKLPTSRFGQFEVASDTVVTPAILVIAKMPDSTGAPDTSDLCVRRATDR